MKTKITFALILCIMLLLPSLWEGSGMGLFANNITQANIKGQAGIMVNSYTGSVFYKRTDVFINGRGLPLEISFVYNSSNTALNDGYGYGWTMNYNIRYEKSGNNIIIRRGDGRKDVFTASGTAFTAPVGIFDTLVEYLPHQFRLSDTHGTQYFFDDSAHKKLTHIADRNGNTITLSYTGKEPTTITDASGRTLTLTWTNHRLTQIISATLNDPLSVRTYSYQYDASGNLISFTDPLGKSIAYAYSDCKDMLQITDKRGNNFNITYNYNSAVTGITSAFTNQTIAYDTTNRQTIMTEQVGSTTQTSTYAYDAQGRVIHIKGNCCGKDVHFGYDAANNVTQYTDANGNVFVKTYDTKGNLLTELDPLGNTTIFTYEPTFNFVKTYTDKKGNTSTSTFDSRGNLTQLSKPLGITESYTYDSFGNKTSATDGRGNTTNYTYNNNGDVTQINYPIGSVSYTVDNIGNTLSKTDANNNTTAYTYDALNRLLTVTDPLAKVTRYVYDAAGNVTSTTVEQITNLFYYDALNRLSSERNPLGETKSYLYDALGNRTVITNPNGNVITTVYDDKNNPIGISDVLGTVSTSTYDNISNLLSQTDANGNTSVFTYDKLNRMLTATDALSNVTGKNYDANGNLTSESDRNGNSTTYTYDALNRLTATHYANSSTIGFAYDANGNKTAATDAKGNTTGYTYDANNRLTKETFADASSKTYSYDAQGNVLSRTDNNGDLTNYTYDKLNRLTSRTYPDATNDAFTYDATGRMLTANNASATITFTYDNADRLLSETLNGKTTAYGYDIPNRKRTITYPSGKVVEENKTLRELLNTVKDGSTVITNFAYDAANRETTRTYANGTATNFSYDNDNRITNLTHTNSSTQIAAFNYGFDNEGNALYAEKLHRTTNSEKYTYDALYQLADYKEGTLTAGNIPSPLTQTQYNYDGAGNRTTVNKDNATITYATNSTNEYTTINTNALIYDANGNMLSDGNYLYQYDFENHLVAVKTPKTKPIPPTAVVARAMMVAPTTAVKLLFKYDALGRRVNKMAGKAKIDYYFDGYRVLEERENLQGNKTTTTYIYGMGIDEILSMQKGSNTYYYHANALGSTVAVTDNSGNVAERYEYDAYGTPAFYTGNYVLLQSSAIGNNYLFTGREYDAESGLYYYRTRYYNPVLGRFMQRDMIGIWGDEGNRGNGYGYVGNNVVNWRDPWGLLPNATHCYEDYNYASLMADAQFAGSAAICGIFMVLATPVGGGGCLAGAALVYAFNIAKAEHAFDKCIERSSKSTANKPLRLPVNNRYPVMSFANDHSIAINNPFDHPIKINPIAVKNPSIIDVPRSISISSYYKTTTSCYRNNLNLIPRSSAAVGRFITY